MKTNEVLENIKARRSVRAYTGQQVLEEDLQAILEAATYAQSGMHLETWHFTAIQNMDKLTELNERIKGAFAKRRIEIKKYPKLTEIGSTLPKEPSSKLAVFTPIALNALTIVEKDILFPLSIFEICALLTPISSPNCSWVRFLASLARVIASPIRKLLVSVSYFSRAGVPFVPITLSSISS